MGFFLIVLFTKLMSEMDMCEPYSSVSCKNRTINNHFLGGFLFRNGTPRQSLLVPLARARLVFSARIPPASIEGIGEYSHYWVIYVFHLNTDLDK